MDCQGGGFPNTERRTLYSQTRAGGRTAPSSLDLRIQVFIPNPAILNFAYKISPRPPILAATALAIYAAWARGGTPSVLQLPLPILAALLLLTQWVFPREATPSPRRQWLRDPFAWIGLLFLLLLSVQWWNAGRFHYFSPFSGAWGYTPPRIPWLPSAITRAEAAEMLRWFSPAWALLIFLRHDLANFREARWMLRALGINGAALAVFGIVQQLSSTPSIFWLSDLEGTRFFASFGYENHAGSYFVLMSAISVGLLLHEILRPDRPPRSPVLAGWGLLSVINFLGANLSYSRAGILLAWVLVAVALAYLLWQGYQRWLPSSWINVGLASLLVAALVFLALDRLGGETIGREMAIIRKALDPEAAKALHKTLAIGDRVAMLQAAGNIWQDYPWFGCGGWGYRYLMPYELPEDDWKWSSTTLGKANVHNDPAQFLAEFGAVGTGLMALCAIGLALPALLARPKRPITVLTITGAAFVVVHSLVDLPFRCPAIVYAWLIALGCVSVWERRGRAAGSRGH